MTTGKGFIKEYSIEYSWTIDKIKSMIQTVRIKNKYISVLSPEFSVNNEETNDLWSLQLDIEKRYETWLSIHLLSKNKTRSIQTKFLVYILNKSKKKIVHKLKAYDEWRDNWREHCFEEPKNSCLTTFFDVDILFKKKNELLPNDTLTVGVDLIVYGASVPITSTVEPLRFSEQKLANDFKDLLASKNKCDVTIKVDNETFDAHKVILSARSCVFDAMFSHNMKENLENEVTIPDIKPETFRKVLSYVYTDRVDDLGNFAEELLEASDKYQLHGLKELCEHFLSKSMSVKNAIKVLILADHHNAKRLTELTITYIVNNFALFRVNEEFKTLEETHLLLFVEILKKYAMQ